MNFKEEYNKLLAREKKAESYLMDERVPVEEREKWLPEYLRIVQQLGHMIYEYTQQGFNITVDEELNGFKDI